MDSDQDRVAEDRGVQAGEGEAEEDEDADVEQPYEQYRCGSVGDTSESVCVPREWEVF